MYFTENALTFKGSAIWIVLWSTDEPMDDVTVTKSQDVILNLLSVRQELQMYGHKFFVISNDDKLTSHGP